MTTPAEQAADLRRRARRSAQRASIAAGVAVDPADTPTEAELLAAYEALQGELASSFDDTPAPRRPPRPRRQSTPSTRKQVKRASAKAAGKRTATAKPKPKKGG